MGLSRSRFNDVCPQHREIALTNPAVEYSASCFHIMISHVPGIVSHKIHHLGTYVRCHCIYIIIIVCRRLSLQNISVIQQYKVFLIHLPVLLHQCIYTCKTSAPLLLCNEVIWKVITMYITGLHNFQFHLSLLCRQHTYQAEQESIHTNQSFHHNHLLNLIYHQITLSLTGRI